MDTRHNLSSNHIVIFTRYPELGKTKTRLITELGAEGAAELQREMAEHAVGRVRGLIEARPISVEVRYQGGSMSLMKQWLGTDILYREQHGTDLGDRMLTAFIESFRDGADYVLLIGTDCPGITVKMLEKGFQDLERNDLVLGPAVDGGYYLIGLKRVCPELFSSIPWGSEKVLELTLEVARLQGLSTILLDLLHDVDRPEDLDIWRSFEKSESLISVIIPTWNEESNISFLLEELISAPNVEIIVVDGNSNDRTREIAESHDIEVIRSSRGRAIQMNTGAKKARGDILLFLHADTRLPTNWASIVSNALAEPGTVAGAFEFAIDAKMRKLRIIERLTNFRSRKFQLPYGDQALFIKADLFRRIGGYNDLPIMEDFELVRRLRKFGRIITLPAPAVTSGRRWRNLGILRTTLINQAIILGYFLGISPARLAKWYREDSRN